MNISKSLPNQKKHKPIDIFKKYTNVFSWGYKVLKAYDSGIIQHTILIKEKQKPFRRKLRKVNHVLLSLVEKVVRKIFYAKIIVTLKFSK